MLTYYSFSQDVPVPLIPENYRTMPVPDWINLENPSPEECADIHERYGVPLEHLQAVLDYNERPRMEHDDKAVLLIVRAPVQDDKHRRAPFSTCPVAVILTPLLAITVCVRENLVTDLLKRKFKGSSARLNIRLALLLLLRVSTTFIQHLRLMDEQVERLEQALAQSMRNQELLSMLHLEKSLIYFLTALKGNHAVMEKLAANTRVVASPEELELLDDALIESKQATDMAEIYSQIMGSLSDAFGAIVSNNVNKVMKVLTGLTIVFMIPSIIGALYGMNVPLPWQDKPYAFAGLCALCALLSFAVYRALKKMDWM